jgi:hypothetical protein
VTRAALKSLPPSSQNCWISRENAAAHAVPSKGLRRRPDDGNLRKLSMAVDRLTLVESTVHEHSLTLTVLRESSARVEQRLDGVDQRLGAVGQRLDRIEQRLDRVEQRLDRVEQQIEVRFHGIEGRFDRLEDRLFRTLVWVVGVQVTVVLVVVGSVVSIALTAPR